MNKSTKVIVQTGILLAICIASQFMKNLSVYITGPIVNMTIIMAVLVVGLWSGIVLSVVSPLTAFLIAPSPILQGIPAIIPCIMVGNALLSIGIWLFKDKILTEKIKTNVRVIIGMLVGALAKAAFMGVTISLVLLPMFKGNIDKPAKMLNTIVNTAQVTFSVTQFITAIIGCVLCYVIWLRIKDVVKNS